MATATDQLPPQAAGGEDVCALRGGWKVLGKGREPEDSPRDHSPVATTNELSEDGYPISRAQVSERDQP